MSSIDFSSHLPDILAHDLDVIFVGINPGLGSATSGHHFVNRSNRFWRVLHLAGFTPEQILPEDDHSILNHRCGLTVVVSRPTVRAEQIRPSEFLEATAALAQKIQRYAPRHVAFLGKPAFSTMFKQREISWGRQPSRFGGTHMWVLPNPSGLNRSFNLNQLVDAYRVLRCASTLSN